MSNQEKIFADGVYFKRNEKAPEWVVGKLSVKIEQFRGLVQQHQKDGWLNLEIKQAKSGSYYVELDTFEPSPKAVHDHGMQQAKEALEDIDDEELPF